MTTLTPFQAWSLFSQAGFSGESAIDMTAIAWSESSLNDKAIGDVGLENATWGPSVGLGQERTLKGETGTGQDRDMSWLLASDANQAKAAYDTSHGGHDFTAWTTFTDGAYQSHLAAVRNAVAAGGGTAQLAGMTTSTQPVSLTSDLVSGLTSQVLPGFRNIAIEVAVAGAGLLLVGLGLSRLAAPKIQQTQQKLQKVGKEAGQIALLAA
jgi:Lysozyme like domain